MIVAGEVGARFVVEDLASGVLERLSGLFDELNSAIRITKEQLGTFVAPGLSKTLEQITGLKTELSTIGGAADKGAAGVSVAFGSIDKSIDATIGRVDALKVSLASVAAAPKIAEAAATRAPGAYGPNGERLPEGSGGRSIRGGHENPLRALRPVTRALGLPAEFAAAAFSPGGMAAMAAAYAATKSFEAGAKLTHEQITAQEGGVSATEAAKAADVATQLGNKYGFDSSAVLRTLNEVRVPVGGESADAGMERAIGLGDSLVSFAANARQVGGKKGDEALDQLYAAVKSGELRNLVDPAQYAGIIAAEGKIFAGTGGRVAPNDMQQALKYMKAEGMTVDTDFVEYKLPAFVQEFRASTAGQMLAGAYQTWIGGHNQKTAIKEGERLGLYDEHGRFKFEHDLLTSPGKAFAEVGDVLRAHGYTTDEAIAGEVAKIVSNRNVAELVTKGIIGAPQLLNTENSIRRSLDAVDATKLTLNSDPMQAMDRVTSGFNNLAAAFTGPLIPGVTQGLNDLANGLNAAVGPAREFGEDLAAIDSWLHFRGPHEYSGRYPGRQVPGYAGGDDPSTSLWAPQRDTGPDAAIESAMKVARRNRDDTRTWWEKWLIPESGRGKRAPGPALPDIPALPIPTLPPITRADLPYLNNQNLQGIGAPGVLGIAPQIQGSLQALPGQVDPAVRAAFSSIGAEINNAIASMAASARGAASAIPPAAHTQIIETTANVNVDGRRLGQVSAGAILAANRSVNGPALNDTSAMAAWPDMAAG